MMSGKKAIVTLYPLDASDVLPCRSLTFTSDSDNVEIGRASKREKKNLIPTDHNGLFDSRVMSRNHARLHVCLDEKIVYLSDGNSMHGTWVNGERIPVGKDITIRNGDIVVFGAEVIRGHETFPPLSVRCEHQWLDSGDGLMLNASDDYQEKRATNTFCVPDDDDDYDNEMTYDPAVETSSESAGSDSDDNSVMEVSSPVTSPPKGGELVGSQQRPIDIDGEQAEQPLATPRMTPPLTIDVPEEASNKVHDSDSHSLHNAENGLVFTFEEHSVAEPSDWEGEDDDQAASEDDSMSDSQSESESESESDGEESDSDRISVRLSPAPYLSGHQGLQVIPTCSSYDASNRDSYLKGKREEYTPDVIWHTTASSRVEMPLFNATAPSLDKSGTSWPVAAGNEADSSLPLQPTGKLFDHSLTGFCNTCTQAIEDWQSHTTHSPAYPLAGHCSPRIPYKDGPFANTLSHFVDGNNGADTVVATTAATVNGDTEARHAGVDCSQAEVGNAVDFGQAVLPPTSVLERPRGQECGNPDSSSEATATQRQGLKRKATDDRIDSQVHDTVTIQDIYPCAEIGSSVDEKSAVEEDESYIPDAQPQITVPDLGCMPSQLTELCTATGSQIDNCTLPAPESGRPSKRLKTAETTSFKSHAATAVLGAMVGAVGTIAVLASLPADYFS
ncbi:hypothetical protein BDV28DRAFT_130180 [Aspergillus coremiiformis]|uniref:FHA domain-containing protein n=1 Tax=Aspergillus coremiiformis TaxID=138285 RepID=A0A5N6ZDI1_9EURO|nr:hypothetical protein BDV28DRAFT_130180 [Aspergillus coremiiformis]